MQLLAVWGCVITDSLLKIVEMSPEVSQCLLPALRCCPFYMDKRIVVINGEVVRAPGIVCWLSSGAYNGFKGI